MTKWWKERRTPTQSNECRKIKRVIRVYIYIYIYTLLVYCNCFMLRGRGWSCCEQPPDAHPASSQSDSLFAGCSGDTVILKKHVEDGRWLEGEQWAVHHCARRCLKEPSTDHRPQRGGEGRGEGGWAGLLLDGHWLKCQKGFILLNFKSSQE